MSGKSSRWFSYASGQKRYVDSLLGACARPRAAVVLLPDWRGQSELALDHAEHLVGLGCAVVVADLYGDGDNPTSPAQVSSMVQRLVAERQDGVAALDACVEALWAEVPPARRCSALASAPAAW